MTPKCRVRWWNIFSFLLRDDTDCNSFQFFSLERCSGFLSSQTFSCWKPEKINSLMASAWYFNLKSDGAEADVHDFDKGELDEVFLSLILLYLVFL